MDLVSQCDLKFWSSIILWSPKVAFNKEPIWSKKQTKSKQPSFFQQNPTTKFFCKSIPLFWRKNHTFFNRSICFFLTVPNFSTTKSLHFQRRHFLRYLASQASGLRRCLRRPPGPRRASASSSSGCTAWIWPSSKKSKTKALGRRQEPTLEGDFQERPIKLV